ncbi:MAG: hypothetical protein C0599_04220 [Salinivirgaceae bacterium]|nr:MAG: hypothetical protein C0599_04220 [Salinivirgaceae bacterium]
MVKRITILFVLALLLNIEGNAQQQQYQYLNTWNQFDSLQSNNLFFRFENANFFRNDEYTSPILDGYTLIGLWGRLLFEYYPSENLRIKIGTHLLKYHGREEIEGVEAIPYYTLQYKPTKDFSIVFGNFDNSRNMDLLAPLYEPEMFYTQKPPAGLMVNYANDRVSVKSWINWETHIFEGDPFQEKFLFGLSSDFKWINNGVFELSTPLQFTYHHVGGEIDSSENLIQTLMNGATGIKALIKSGDWSYGISGYYLGYREATSNGLQPYRAGQGGLTRLNVGYKQSLVSLGYWNGKQFLSPKGRSIYQSYSISNPGELYPNREIVEGRFLFNWPIKDFVHLVLEADAFYDLNESDLSYAWGIHLIFSESFFLTHVKKKTNN